MPHESHTTEAQEAAHGLVALWEDRHGGMDIPGGTLDDMAAAAVGYIRAYFRRLGEEESDERLAERHGLVPVLTEDKVDGSDVATVPWVEVVRALREAQARW